MPNLMNPAVTDRPKEFLIDQLEQLNVSKVHPGNPPCLFNESNLVALFGILDPSHQGFITYSQYKEGKTAIMLQRLWKEKLCCNT